LRLRADLGQASAARLTHLEDDLMNVLAFGGPQSGVYRVLLLLHIVSIVAAFAPAFAHPFLVRQGDALAAGPRQQLLGFLAQNSKRIYAPALIAAGIFGLLLVASSDKAWDFGQGWISMAFLLWIIMNGVLHGVLIPAERKLAQGDEAMRSRADAMGALLSVLFVLMLILMIWKPGA
jgi:uncharacterized membrane protein